MELVNAQSYLEHSTVHCLVFEYIAVSHVFRISGYWVFDFGYMMISDNVPSVWENMSDTYSGVGNEIASYVSGVLFMDLLFGIMFRCKNWYIIFLPIN